MVEEINYFSRVMKRYFNKERVMTKEDDEYLDLFKCIC